MIPIVILRKIILFFAPIVIFYILRKIGRKDLKRKSRLQGVDKSQIVEGEIVEEKE